MNFASIRVITEDVARLVTAYEAITGLTAQWAAPEFAEIVTPRATLAIGALSTVAVFGDQVTRAADNRSVIIEFQVDDVDAAFANIDQAADLGLDVVQSPTTMPWGNRSALIHDPDGNLVNLFTPVTSEAIARFEKR